jgi:hypothetical protein
MGKVDNNLEVTAFFKNKTHVLTWKLVYITNKITQRKVTGF